MPARAQLLVCCSKGERDEVRKAAAKRRQTISGYVLALMDKALDLDDALLKRIGSLPSGRFNALHPVRPRVTLLVHCSRAEADRVRKGAAQRQTTLSSFVLHCLRRSWLAEKTVLVEWVGDTARKERSPRRP